jgi:hypothetical protein
MTKKTKGKIASLTIVLLVALPLIYSFADFYWIGVKGARADTRVSNTFAIQNPLSSIKLDTLIPDFGKTTSTASNKNKDLLYVNNVSTSGAKNEATKPTPEGGANQLVQNINPPFKTKIVIRNQQAEALANNYIHLKNSYDVTLNKNTTTIFISGIDPKLTEDRSIAINYTLAKRLGLEAKDGIYEAVAVRKR